MRKACNCVGASILLFAGIGNALVLVLLLGIIILFPVVYYQYPLILTMIINDLALYGIGGFLFWLMVKGLPSITPVSRGMSIPEFLKCFLETIGIMYGMSFLTTFITSLFTQATGVELSNSLDSVSDMSLLAIFIFFVVIAPVCEEILYRRILLNRLLPYGGVFAALISGLLFGLFHLNINQFFYATALGVFFAYVAIKTGQLRWSILMHAGINFLGSVMIMLVEPYDMLSGIYSICIITLMVIGLILLFRDRRQILQTLSFSWHQQVSMRYVFTSPGMLACCIILGIFSIVNCII